MSPVFPVSVAKTLFSLVLIFCAACANADNVSSKADTLIEAGKSALTQNAASEALSNFEDCRMSLESLAPSLQLATCLDGIGKAQIELAHYNEAFTAFQRALTLREQLLGSRHVLVAESLGALAGIEITLGKHALARDHFERAIVIYLEEQGEDGPDTAQYRLWLGLAQRGLGDYQAAMKSYQRSLQTMRKIHGAAHAGTAMALFRLAGLQLSLGEVEQALLNYEALLAVQRQLPGTSIVSIGKTLGNIAEVKRRMGQYDAALGLLLQAITCYDQSSADDRLDLATLHYNLGSNYRLLHNYEAAAENMRKSISIREAVQGSWHPRLALMWRGVSIVNMEKGDTQASLDAMLNGAAIAFANDLPEPQADMYEGLARVFASKNPQIAILFAKLSVNQYERLISNAAKAGKGLQKSFLNDNINVYRALAEMLLGEGRIDEAREVFECLRTWEYAEFTNNVNNPAVLSLTPVELRLNAQLEHHIQTLHMKNRLLQKAEEAYQSKVSTTLDLVRKSSAIELLEAQKNFFSEIDAMLSLTPQPRYKATGILGATREARLEYFYGPHKIFIVLSTPARQEVVVLKSARANLKSQIDEFRRKLANPAEDLRQNAHALHEILINPVLNWIRQDQITHLYISPDSELRYLPFSALMHSGRYLIQDYTLANQTGSTSLKASEKPKRDLKLAQFGTSSGVGDLPSLVGVKAEVDGIIKAAAKLSNPDDVYLDQTFTADNLRKVLKGDWTAMHFATHFVLKPGNDAESYLLLGDGSKLNLKDWRSDDYDFSRIELLSLSACNTAVDSKNAFGKEIDGLAVLLQKKGARTIIATLWQVDDLGASKIMPRFYAALARGRPANDALRLAQLSFLKEGNAAIGKHRGLTRIDAGAYKKTNEKAHPYYWAPFLLMQSER